MTAENLRWLENVFRRTVGENGEIRLQDFKNIVHSKNVRYFLKYIVYQCTKLLANTSWQINAIACKDII